MCALTQSDIKEKKEKRKLFQKLIIITTEETNLLLFCVFAIKIAVCLYRLFHYLVGNW